MQTELFMDQVDFQEEQAALQECLQAEIVLGIEWREEEEGKSEAESEEEAEEAWEEASLSEESMEGMRCGTDYETLQECLQAEQNRSKGWQPAEELGNEEDLEENETEEKKQRCRCFPRASLVQPAPPRATDTAASRGCCG